jgi:hypothetical protein
MSSTSTDGNLRYRRSANPHNGIIMGMRYGIPPVARYEDATATVVVNT